MKLRLRRRNTELERVGKKTCKLTGRNARADVHGGDLDLLASSQVPPLEPGDGGTFGRGGRGGGSRGSGLSVASAWASGGFSVVVDDDADASTTLASSELNLGSLDQGSLSVLQGTVEAGLTLGEARCLSFLSGRDLLAHALKRGDLLGLNELTLVSYGVPRAMSPLAFLG